MVVIIARWTVQSDSISSILKLMGEMQKSSRQETGNLSYEVYQDPQSPAKILIYEEYKNAEAVEAHRMSLHFQELVVKQIVPHLVERSIQVFEK